MKHCEICLKAIGDGEYNGMFCEVGCDRRFCSIECADLDASENTFPNCYPGIYWCGLCKREYLEAANGHLFIVQVHPASKDLEIYLGKDNNYENGALVDRCVNCNMWYYEFKSSTDMPGKYEGYACNVWLEEGIV
jgi:hypothetical protein